MATHEDEKILNFIFPGLTLHSVSFQKRRKQFFILIAVSLWDRILECVAALPDMRVLEGCLSIMNNIRPEHLPRRTVILEEMV